jgi:hypothetical protein
VPVQQPILNPAEENDEEDDLPNTAGIMRQLGGPQQSVVGTPNPSTPLVNTTIPAHPEAKVQEDDFTYTPSSTFSFASQK